MVAFTVHSTFLHYFLDYSVHWSEHPEKGGWTWVDITESTQNLKDFLAVRDKNHVFDELRAAGNIGIPCFVMENGEVLLDAEKACAMLDTAQEG